MALYRGFSLHEYRTKQTTKLTDVELVKMNILTHIYTLKGERLMMSNFGTSIPELIFEPLTEDVIEIIRRDLEAVCKYDPRVELQELKVTPLWDEGVVLVDITLNYLELNTVDTLSLKLEFEE